MPIISKREADARRAAKAERDRLAQRARTPGTEEPPRNEVGERPKRRRGHAKKGADGKWQPTAGYPNGFARTSEENRFKPGCKPGPGRPKGSLSHDTMMKQALEKKRPIRIDGKERNVSTRELIILTTVKDAVEGKDRNARKHALAEMQRLYPADNTPHSTAAELNASDALSLAEFEAELRRQVREEILRELDGSDGETGQ